MPQQQQRVCTPMVVVAFVIGCQVAVMVMHAGRHDAHVAREGKRWHRNDFAAPPTTERRAEPPERRAAEPPERSAAKPVPPERRAAEPPERNTATASQPKTQLSAAEEELIQGLPTAAERAEARKIFEERLQGPLAFGNALESAVEDDDEADSIPDFYGKPAILGLERCATFRETTSEFRRAATAGLFNTGTNLLTNLVRKNCVVDKACPEKMPQKQKMAMMARGECIGYPFQVPWGKHNPLHFRGRHVVDRLDHFNISEVLPAVLVKDPLTWARSMCRTPYAARFGRGSCCPSPLDPGRLRAMRNVTVNFKKGFPMERYAHLLDFWNSWYAQYYTTEIPRLIVRYEDLLFAPKRTVRAVCECVGGKLRRDFDSFSDAAKFGRGHGGGDGTGRASALARYASEATRYANLDAGDLAFYTKSAHPDLVGRFHYEADDARRRAADSKACPS
jgi:hypothetical protein